MPKFFVKENQISNNKIEIVGDDVNHITNVLRMKQGEILKVCNQETGENYIAEIINAQKNSVTCEIQEKLEETAESNVDITLYQGLPKFEKMELIIQKNTEVGVNAIVPVIMERTVVKLDEKQVSKKLERWQKIAEIAAKQSMRDKIPEIKNIIKINKISDSLKNEKFDTILVAYENEEKTMLKKELKKLENLKDKKYKIAIIIGPEGGISEREIEQLNNLGAKCVSLGRRILRTETAGIIMSGDIMYELEN
jgi:16S rRNA (uracil1498-N3)-methyltransferase